MASEDYRTLHIEFCIRCASHTWCTHHNQAKYRDTFEKIANAITHVYPQIQVIGNSVPENYVPIKVNENKYYDVTKGKYVNFPIIGAFQIKYKGQFLFSKKKTNMWPTIEQIVDQFSIAYKGVSIQQVPKKSDRRRVSKDNITLKQQFEKENQIMDDSDKRSTFYKQRHDDFTLTDHFKFYNKQKQSKLPNRQLKTQNGVGRLPVIQNKSKEKEATTDFNVLKKSLERLCSFRSDSSEHGTVQGIRRKQLENKLDSIEQQSSPYNEQLRSLIISRHRNQDMMEQWDQELNQLEKTFKNFEQRIKKRSHNKVGELDSKLEEQIKAIINNKRAKEAALKRKIESNLLKQSKYSKIPQKEKENIENSILRQMKNHEINRKLQKIQQYLRDTDEQKNQKLKRIYGQWNILKKHLPRSYQSQNRKIGSIKKNKIFKNDFSQEQINYSSGDEDEYTKTQKQKIMNSSKRHVIKPSHNKKSSDILRQTARLQDLKKGKYQKKQNDKQNYIKPFKTPKNPFNDTMGNFLSRQKQIKQNEKKNTSKFLKKPLLRSNQIQTHYPRQNTDLSSGQRQTQNQNQGQFQMKNGIKNFGFRSASNFKLKRELSEQKLQIKRPKLFKDSKVKRNNVFLSQHKVNDDSISKISGDSSLKHKEKVNPRFQNLKLNSSEKMVTKEKCRIQKGERHSKINKNSINNLIYTQKENSDTSVVNQKSSKKLIIGKSKNPLDKSLQKLKEKVANKPGSDNNYIKDQIKNIKQQNSNKNEKKQKARKNSNLSLSSLSSQNTDIRQNSGKRNLFQLNRKQQKSKYKNVKNLKQQQSSESKINRQEKNKIHKKDNKMKEKNQVSSKKMPDQSQQSFGKLHIQSNYSNQSGKQFNFRNSLTKFIKKDKVIRKNQKDFKFSAGNDYNKQVAGQIPKGLKIKHIDRMAQLQNSDRCLQKNSGDEQVSIKQRNFINSSAQILNQRQDYNRMPTKKQRRHNHKGSSNQQSNLSEKSKIQKPLNNSLINKRISKNSNSKQALQKQLKKMDNYEKKKPLNANFQQNLIDSEASLQESYKNNISKKGNMQNKDKQNVKSKGKKSKKIVNKSIKQFQQDKQNSKFQGLNTSQKQEQQNDQKTSINKIKQQDRQKQVINYQIANKSQQKLSIQINCEQQKLKSGKVRQENKNNKQQESLKKSKIKRQRQKKDNPIKNLFLTNQEHQQLQQQQQDTFSPQTRQFSQNINEKKKTKKKEIQPQQKDHYFFNNNKDKESFSNKQQQNVQQQNQQNMKLNKKRKNKKDGLKQKTLANKQIRHQKIWRQSARQEIKQNQRNLSLLARDIISRSSSQQKDRKIKNRKKSKFAVLKSKQSQFSSSQSQFYSENSDDSDQQSQNSQTKTISKIQQAKVERQEKCQNYQQQSEKSNQSIKKYYQLKDTINKQQSAKISQSQFQRKIDSEKQQNELLQQAQIMPVVVQKQQKKTQVEQKTVKEKQIHNQQSEKQIKNQFQSSGYIKNIQINERNKSFEKNSIRKSKKKIEKRNNNEKQLQISQANQKKSLKLTNNQQKLPLLTKQSNQNIINCDELLMQNCKPQYRDQQSKDDEIQYINSSDQKFKESLQSLKQENTLENKLSNQIQGLDLQYKEEIVDNKNVIQQQANQRQILSSEKYESVTNINDKVSLGSKQQHSDNKIQSECQNNKTQAQQLDQKSCHKPIQQKFKAKKKEKKISTKQGIIAKQNVQKKLSNKVIEHLKSKDLQNKNVSKSNKSNLEQKKLNSKQIISQRTITKSQKQSELSKSDQKSTSSHKRPSISSLEKQSQKSEFIQQKQEVSDIDKQKQMNKQKRSKQKLITRQLKDNVYFETVAKKASIKQCPNNKLLISIGVQKDTPLQKQIQTDYDGFYPGYQQLHSSRSSKLNSLNQSKIPKAESKFLEESPANQTQQFERQNMKRITQESQQQIRRQCYNRAQIIKQLYGKSINKQKTKYPVALQNAASKLLQIDIQKDSLTVKCQWRKLSEVFKSSGVKLFDKKSLNSSCISFGQHNMISFRKIIKIMGEKNQLLITRLFQNIEQIKAGIFGVWLCDNYQWKCVIINQLIPVGKNDQIIFSYSDDCQIWPIILQKAMAKLVGGYQNLSKVSVNDLFHFLTGSNYMNFRIKEEWQKNRKFVKFLAENQKKNFIIYAQKVFSNLEQKEKKNKDISIFYIISQKVINQNEILLKIKQNEKQPFMIKLELFATQFHSVSVLQLRMNHNFTSVAIPSNNAKNYVVFELAFEQNLFGSITLSNPSKLGHLKIFLYREEQTNVLRLVGQAKQKEKPKLFFDCLFFAGKYFLFADSQFNGSRISYFGEGTPKLSIKQQIKMQGLKNSIAQYLPINKLPGKQSYDSAPKMLMLNSSRKILNQTQNSFFKSTNNEKASRLRQEFIEYLMNTRQK